MIATYRDDGLPLDHPVRAVIGHLSGEHVHHLKLEALSRWAVEYFAQQAHRQVHNLYELTGGNPYYVTEILTSETEKLPRSLTEVILGRFAAQPPHVRRILELASIIPKLSTVNKR